jgi:trehalose-6-phosphatase
VTPGGHLRCVSSFGYGCSVRYEQLDHGRTGLATDLDGTLFPDVSNPLAARPVPGARELLMSLARGDATHQRLSAVYLVTGRDAPFVLQTAGFTGIDGYYWFGSQKITADGRETVHEDLALWAGPAQAALADLRASAGIQAAMAQGVCLEDREFGLAANWYAVPLQDRADVEAAITPTVERTLRAHGYSPKPRTMILEGMPQKPLGKEDAIRSLIGEHALETVFWSSDHHKDLPAIHEIERLARAPESTLKQGIIIVVRSKATRPELLDHATWIVDNPTELVDLYHDLYEGEPVLEPGQGPGEPGPAYGVLARAQIPRPSLALFRPALPEMEDHGH